MQDYPERNPDRRLLQGTKLALARMVGDYNGQYAVLEARLKTLFDVLDGYLAESDVQTEWGKDR